VEWLAACGGGAFVLASFVLGLRLMLLASRTRGLPELVLGTGLFLMGGVGYPLLVTAQQAQNAPPDLRVALLVTTMVFNTGGMTAVAWFTRRVFRPASRTAGAAVLGVLATYAGLMTAQGLGPGMEALLADPHGPWWSSTFMSVLVLLWSGVESLRYHLLLRKRLGLGLADPVVADRFRLWAISMFCAGSISASSLALDLLFGVAASDITVTGLLVGPLGLACATALWLAFLPPAAYTRRVQARAAARA